MYNTEKHLMELNFEPPAISENKYHSRSAVFKHRFYIQHRILNAYKCSSQMHRTSHIKRTVNNPNQEIHFGSRHVAGTAINVRLG